MSYFGKNIKTTVNNLNFRYNDVGKDGEHVIIFIHGIPFNKSMWDNQLESLSENFRLISYDLRGFGNSDAGNDNFTIELFVNDLINFMDSLKIKQAVLCGISMGGYIALRAVENYPDRFEGLVLCDTQCTADSPEVKDKRLKTIEKIKNEGIEKFAEEFIQNIFLPESFEKKTEEIANVKEMIINTSEETLYKSLIALSVRKETCSELNKINVPVLILVGKSDKITPVESSQLLQSKIKGSAIYIIENAAHLSNIENPYDFNIQIRKFLVANFLQNN